MATPPSFTSGQILTAAHMNALGLWRVTTVTGGNGTNSLNVPSAFSADYANYRVFVTGGTIAAATTLRMRLGAAATNYYAAYELFGYAAGGIIGGSDNGATYWTQVGHCGTNGTVAAIDLFEPQVNTRTRFATAVPQMVTTGGIVFGGGFHNTVAQYTDFTLTTASAANWTSDLTVEVFGYN